MKRIITLLAILATIIVGQKALAQNKLNESADSVIGKYESVQGGDPYRVQVTKNADGAYKAQIYWLANPNDPKTGERAYDKKNPDKSLRNVPSDQVVLIRDLKYKPEKKQWGDAKIYDPQRGIRANVTAWFTEDGRFCIKGTVLGIGEKAYWTRLSE